jgi:heterodisulfide reductase subunit A
MERAEYVARVDEALCTGCGLCDAECHFKAISSHKHGGVSHAHIDPHTCFGCGLCRRVCDARAISPVLR